MTVPEIILEQLGGNRFVAMTGCNHFLSDDRTLRMRVPRNKSKANRLYITLDWDDTYTMRFFRYTAARFNSKTLTFSEDKTTEIEERSGLYWDQLQEVFTEVTGMYTHL